MANSDYNLGLPTKSLNAAFKVKPRSFFTIGRVFQALWTEPTTGKGFDDHTTDRNMFTVAFGEKVHSKVRYFIVVREGGSSCLCVAIYTHSGRGVKKPVVDTREHAMVYTGNEPPTVASVDTSTLLPAIRVNADSKEQFLGAMSLLDFGRIHTIEHSIKVMSFGKVDQKAIADLQSNVDLVWQWRNEASLKDPQYQTRPREFFKRGRVFSAYSLQGAFPGARMYVLIRTGIDDSWCLPLDTGNRSGVAAHEHAVIYTENTPPKSAPNKDGIRPKAILVLPDSAADQLEPTCRIDFGHVNKISHACKIKPFGNVSLNSMRDLNDQFVSVWNQPEDKVQESSAASKASFAFTDSPPEPEKVSAKDTAVDITSTIPKNISSSDHVRSSTSIEASQLVSFGKTSDPLSTKHLSTNQPGVSLQQSTLSSHATHRSFQSQRDWLSPPAETAQDRTKNEQRLEQPSQTPPRPLGNPAIETRSSPSRVPERSILRQSVALSLSPVDPSFLDPPREIGVTFSSQPLSPGQNWVNIGLENVTSSLFPDFKLRSNAFYSVGRVFTVLWSDPPARPKFSRNSMKDSTVTTYEPGITINQFGERVFSKVRRFVVIREGRGYCSVLPLTTYGGSGVAKRGVVKSDHAIVYTGKTAPPAQPSECPHRGEDGMRSVAIRIDPDHPVNTLDPMTRVNLGGVMTVQSNIKTKAFGIVNAKSLESLQLQFRQAFQGQPIRPLPKQEEAYVEDDDDDEEDNNESDDDDESDEE